MTTMNNTMNNLLAKASILRIPIKVDLELLPVCNLDCKMCYVRCSWNEVNNNGGLKTVGEWLEMAKQLKESGTLFILLSGGEVFLYPEFKRLYIELYKMGFILTINTNATLIDEEAISWLAIYPPKCMSISLYGASNETYEQLCGAKGMYDKVIHAIDLLQKNNIVLECKTLFTPYNIHDIEKIWKIMKSKAIYYEASTYSYPPTRKICNKICCRFSSKECADYRFYANKLMSTPAAYLNEMVKYINKYENTPKINNSIIKGFHCAACNNTCWINWQGKMLPCIILPEPFTLPFEVGFLNAWVELKNKTDQIIMSQYCSNCDFRKVCSACPASVYAETGSLNGKPKYICEMTHYFLEKMYENISEKTKETF